jgi:hypothetical protein
MDETEEVFEVAFPSEHESTEVICPSEEPFHFPSPVVALHLVSIPGFASAPPVGRYHIDVVLGGKFLLERVRVIGFVTDLPSRELTAEAANKNVFHKSALGRRSAFDRYGERKTVISGDSDDFGPLAAPSGDEGETPFWRLRRPHPRTPPPDLVCFAPAVARPVVAAPLQIFHSAPTAGTGDRRPGTADTFPAVCATAPPCPASTVPHLAPQAYHATAVRAPRNTGPATALCSSVNCQRPAILHLPHHTGQFQNEGVFRLKGLRGRF